MNSSLFPVPGDSDSCKTFLGIGSDLKFVAKRDQEIFNGLLVGAGCDAIVYPDDEVSSFCFLESKEETGVRFAMGKALLHDKIGEVFLPHSECLF